MQDDTTSTDTTSDETQSDEPRAVYRLMRVFDERDEPEEIIAQYMDRVAEGKGDRYMVVKVEHDGTVTTEIEPDEVDWDAVEELREYESDYDPEPEDQDDADEQGEDEQGEDDDQDEDHAEAAE